MHHNIQFGYPRRHILNKSGKLHYVVDLQLVAPMCAGLPHMPAQKKAARR